MLSPATGFYKAYSNKHEFHAMEQVSNPIRGGLVIPITVMPLLHKQAHLAW